MTRAPPFIDVTTENNAEESSIAPVQEPSLQDNEEQKARENENPIGRESDQ